MITLSSKNFIMFKNIFTFFAFLFCLPLQAQDDVIAKHENLVYYNSSIKEYLQYMKENTDDPEILELIGSMETQNGLIEEKLAKVVLPEVMEEVPMPAEPETPAEEPEEYTYPEAEESTGDEDFEGFGMNKFIPFRNKVKTIFEIQFGINNFNQKNPSESVNNPEIYTPSSWYWDFSILTKNRLGGKNSKVALSYGFSYLINRFSMDNDVRLALVNNQPEFVNFAEANSNPKLNIGYVTVPVAFDVKLSKGFNFSIGGFMGYRVHTVQKLNSKVTYERIEEERFANYKLNNWIYGAKVSLGLKGINIVGRYCFNNLFRDNPNYEINTFMIGTAIRI